jgi:hypothetical protein
VLINIVLMLVGCTENLSADPPYILTTATTGGTYYPVGVAVATITKSELHRTEGISLSAISSAGSMENIKLMRDNQAQFALLQGIFAITRRSLHCCKAFSRHGHGTVTGRSASHSRGSAVSAQCGQTPNTSCY